MYVQVFTEDILDRENIAQHPDGGPPLTAKVTYGLGIVQMLAPKPAKAFQDYADLASVYWFLKFNAKLTATLNAC